MSKEVPEVGDVFSYKDYKIYVIDVQKDIHCTFLVTDDWKYWTTQAYVFSEYTYLGKSKVCIDDLFKTENEE